MYISVLCDMQSFVVTLLGFDSRISGFVDQHLIHWAIGPDNAKITKPSLQLHKRDVADEIKIRFNN